MDLQNNIPNPINDATSATKSLMQPNSDGVFKQFGNNSALGGSKEFLKSNTLVAKVVFLLLILIIFMFLLRFAVNILHMLFGPKKNPILKPGRFSGGHTDSVSVNPNKKDSKPILRSNNQDMGMEFTYSTWLYFEDDNFINYNPGKTKHIFSKGGLGNGNVASGKLAGMAAQNAPGLYLDGNENKLLVVMQTYKDFGEKIEIPDIPIKKWICVVIRLENRNLDVYVNGTIVVRHELKSVPRQNYSDIYISRGGGFSGEQSSLRYFSKALTSLEIQKLVQKGPNMSSGGVASPFPPYLSMRWFFSRENI